MIDWNAQIMSLVVLLPILRLLEDSSLVEYSVKRPCHYGDIHMVIATLVISSLDG